MGTIVSAAITWNLPRVYTMRAWLKEPGSSGYDRKITRLRAAMTVRQNDLDHRWNISFEDAIETIVKGTTLRDTDRGLEVEVRLLDPLDARVIARTIAFGIDTPRREREMASKSGHLAPFTDAETRTMADIAKLEYLIGDQAREAGFSDGVGRILRAPDDDPKMAALAANEDFSRRLATLKNLSRQIGYYDPPGEPFRGPNPHIELQDLSTATVGRTPDVSLWIRSGQVCGALISLLVIAVLRLWKPGLLRGRDRPATAPAAAQVPPPTAAKPGDSEEW
ncbi:hypothetical protein [Luteolibacter sp. Populi]|uniref:hypothetical protein n=1 Tax=Luteolibacter sp. Populi TaxID=3230487 RepID=UPI003465793A